MENSQCGFSCEYFVANTENVLIININHRLITRVLGTRKTNHWREVNQLRVTFWVVCRLDYPFRKRDSEAVNFALLSEQAAVVQWIKRLSENQLSAVRVGLNPEFWTLDFCFDYSLHIVQEVETTATPVWVQWAHRHYRLHLILYRLVRLRNCSQS